MYHEQRVLQERQKHEIEQEEQKYDPFTATPFSQSQQVYQQQPVSTQVRVLFIKILYGIWNFLTIFISKSSFPSLKFSALQRPSLRTYKKPTKIYPKNSNFQNNNKNPKKVEKISHEQP